MTHTKIYKDTKLSLRTKVRLTPEELGVLRSYLDDQPAAFANIKNNVGISRDTTLRVLKNGWAELRIALPLRDFIKLIPELV